jgi:hypothetical protein
MRSEYGKAAVDIEIHLAGLEQLRYFGEFFRYGHAAAIDNLGPQMFGKVGGWRGKILEFLGQRVGAYRSEHQVRRR